MIHQENIWYDVGYPLYHDNYDKCKLDTVELNFQIIEMNQTVFAK